MARKRNGSEAANERGDQSKDANFQSNLHRCRKSECYEPPDARQFRLNRSAKQFGAMLLVVPEQVANEDGRKIDTGEGGGPTGTDGTHRRRTELSIDQKPVTNGVDDVRGHQRKGDGANHVHALHATPYCEIEEKWQSSPGERH